jgi:transposase
MGGGLPQWRAAVARDPGGRVPRRPAGRDRVEERLYLERLFNISPEVAALHDLAQRFGRMVRQHGADDLTPWLAEALESDLRSFAEGLRRDLAAVWAALATPWSNGQTEGQITRLKLIKRSMYGRAKIDLLRIRVMAA